MSIVWERLLRLGPARVVALGYLSYVMAGWIFLVMPFAHMGDRVSALDALFTATSAVSTTGLVTVSTGSDYSFLGQVVIIVLIQLGGVGYMTLGSFVILSRSNSLSDPRRQIGHAVFSMPAGFRIEEFIRHVVIFTLLTESLGALALYMAFCRAGVPQPLWSSIFHSISAFCTAGFSLYDSSFESLRGDFWVNAILSILSYLGAIGFIVLVDVWNRLIGKSPRLTLTSRVIITTTVWVTLGGTVLFFLGEPSIRGLPAHERLVAACFQVMTAITTVGFNTVPIGALSQASLFLTAMLMIVGASPSGTGGGLKTTTLSAVFGVMRSTLRGSQRVQFWGQTIPQERVWTAMASLGFYTITLVLGCYLLSLTESSEFEGLLFESASALGTVGLSTGITAGLTPLGKMIITVLMFVGRVGPLGFGVALFLSPHSLPNKDADDLAI